MATALKVRAKAAGYRRAGYKFHDKEDTLIPLDQLKKDQIEQLKSDANLMVSEVDVKQKPDAGEGDEAAKAEAKAEADKKAKTAAEAKASAKK